MILFVVSVPGGMIKCSSHQSLVDCTVSHQQNTYNTSVLGIRRNDIETDRYDEVIWSNYHVYVVLGLTQWTKYIHGRSICSGIKIEKKQDITDQH